MHLEAIGFEDACSVCPFYGGGYIGLKKAANVKINVTNVPF